MYRVIEKIFRVCAWIISLAHISSGLTIFIGQLFVKVYEYENNFGEKFIVSVFVLLQILMASWVFITTSKPKFLIYRKLTICLVVILLAVTSFYLFQVNYMEYEIYDRLYPFGVRMALLLVVYVVFLVFEYGLGKIYPKSQNT